MIIQNAVMIVEDWPEVSFLVSSHVHDFKTHVFHDGTSVSVDGGHDYVRRCHPVNFAGYGTKYMDFSLDDREPFFTIKHKLLWGTRGKDGRQPLKWVRLMDCSAEHLQAILDYPYPADKQLSPLYKEVIKDILVKDKHVVPAPPKRYIHKAARPKYHYMNPTVCTNLNMSDEDAHKYSRTRWTNVTCPYCLQKRKHNDFLIMETKQELSEWNMQTLGFALRSLGSAFGHRRDNGFEIIHDVKEAQRQLDTFMGEVIPTPQLTPAGAELSQALHCAMRKWMDGPLSSLLYTMISESRGLRVWVAFVHGLIDNKFKMERAFTMAEKSYRDANSGTDDMFMKCLIEIWILSDGQEDINEVVKHLSIPTPK